MITTVLFDLDGTLLPMDQDVFTKGYFKFLAKKLAPRGYDPAALIDAIWAGTAAMVKNDGSCLNEEAFWRCFCSILGDKVLEDKPLFEEFYAVEFQQAQSLCGFAPEAAKIVADLKARGFRLALATNPIFPTVATESRIRWAGLKREDFELVTVYENTGFSKPNPRYFLDVASRLGVRPEECLMVGNDATEDFAALRAGMQVFLLTDCLINKAGADLSAVPHGSFASLSEFLQNLNH